jgi:hypothetical protein
MVICACGLLPNPAKVPSPSVRLSVRYFSAGIAPREAEILYIIPFVCAAQQYGLEFGIRGPRPVIVSYIFKK